MNQSSYPAYDGKESAEDRMASCIQFELDRHGNALAAARAVLRDIRHGYLSIDDDQAGKRHRRALKSIACISIIPPYETEQAGQIAMMKKMAREALDPPNA